MLVRPVVIRQIHIKRSLEQYTIVSYHEILFDDRVDRIVVECFECVCCAETSPYFYSNNVGVECT